MKKGKLSPREAGMLVVLVVLLIGVVYYMGFYTPLQAEMSSIAAESAQCDDEIVVANAKVAKMGQMQAELDEIFARPADEITEIAPYDNKEVVLTQLYGILGRSESYSLDFTDHSVGDDGTVRRNISMHFTCDNYNAAKAILRDLTDSQWRCLVSNVAIVASGEDLMKDPVTVNVTITYFEHTDLAE